MYNSNCCPDLAHPERDLITNTITNIVNIIPSCL